MLFTARRRATTFIVVFASVAFWLGASSTLRPTGDAGEYISMATNLANLQPPSLTASQLETFARRYAGDVSGRLTDSKYRAVDSRQELPHFWFYPLLAAPFVRIAQEWDADPILGFTVLNTILLCAAGAILAARTSLAIAVLVLMGPILWWIDKAQVEAFTLAMLTLGIVFLVTAPWWSIVAFSAAATQNPPISVAMGGAIVAAFARQGLHDWRPWAATAAGLGLASLHPLYYDARLNLWSGLAFSVDRHWPSTREVLSVAIDPNLGILVHDPFLALAVAAGFVAWLRRPHRLKVAEIVVLLSAAVFFFSFTQTFNVNSGGTPGPSRYGLWLLPLAIVVLRHAAPRPMIGLAIASVVWTVVRFAPAIPEQYLRPTSLAAIIWDRWPTLDNPVAEVFAERVAQVEPAPAPPLSTRTCSKVLLVGNGSDARWPARCDTAEVPSFCRGVGALCYANRSSNGYRFAAAPFTPAWYLSTMMPPVRELPAGEFIVLPLSHTADSPIRAVWLDTGWSYREEDVSRDTAVREQWRWMADVAQVGVVTGGPTRIRMTILARAFAQSRRLNVSVMTAAASAETVQEVLISTERSEYVIGPLDIGSGKTILRFESVDGAERPGTEDPRSLSISLYRLEIEEHPVP